jgi:hypothetical protein
MCDAGTCRRVAGTWLCKQQTSCTTSARRAQRGVCRHTRCCLGSVIALTGHNMHWDAVTCGGAMTVGYSL